ncbi:uncharacterized protein LOC117175627 [Belonocnema kinseyi]|uniref:uncharacterized protein LOC117175627 n=1 Tax=Belonocnema kinseyi TaxID=2817044 RepID=UPI00143DF82F|nr:uncharacterized protein LOC117175627 [Belonocnema kinseyi]
MVLAYSLRFIQNLRTKDPSRKLQGPLSFKEIDTALLAVVKLVQKDTFHKDIDLLSRGEILDKKSSLLSLTPFIAQGIIRVGSRLERANIPYAKKHPVVLPKGHYITKLIMFQSEASRH